METAHRVNGVVVGVYMGFRDCTPLVVFPGNRMDVAVPARTTVPLDGVRIGAQVALMFEDGNIDRPLIMGQILPSALVQPEVHEEDERRLVLKAEEAIEIRVGRASIVMHADGRIAIRGARIVSEASGPNRIRGGSVHLN
jgi:hypothetical protein